MPEKITMLTKKEIKKLKKRRKKFLEKDTNKLTMVELEEFNDIQFLLLREKIFNEAGIIIC